MDMDNAKKKAADDLSSIIGWRAKPCHPIFWPRRDKFVTKIEVL
jgi:hypothetical protein